MWGTFWLAFLPQWCEWSKMVFMQNDLIPCLNDVISRVYCRTNRRKWRTRIWRRKFTQRCEIIWARSLMRGHSLGRAGWLSHHMTSWLLLKLPDKNVSHFYSLEVNHYLQIDLVLKSIICLVRSACGFLDQLGFPFSWWMETQNGPTVTTRPIFTWNFTFLLNNS